MMASVTILTNPESDIDYSLKDGRIRSFVCYGEKLFDDESGICVDGWRDKLTQFVVEYGLDKDERGIGLHSFVYRMYGDGLLNE